LLRNSLRRTQLLPDCRRSHPLRQQARRKRDAKNICLKIHPRYSQGEWGVQRAGNYTWWTQNNLDRLVAELLANHAIVAANNDLDCAHLLADDSRPKPLRPPESRDL
jgi:hypothetical protein